MAWLSVMAVLFEVKLKDEWFKENIMRPIRGRRPGMTRPTRGGVNPRRPGMTRPMPTRVGTAGTPVPRRTGSAFEGRPAPTPMPTRGGMGMNPSGPAPKPAPTPMPTRGGMGMNPISPGNTNVRTASPGMKKGGKVKKHRGDGCCMKGKTKGRMV